MPLCATCEGESVEKMLKPYKGRLDPGQIADGMNVALRNAQRLVHDAELLLAADSFAGAASLAILAIEESAKTSILRGLATATTDADVAAAWRHYRSHTSKNAAWLLPQLAASGARRLEDFRPLFDKASDHPQLLDALKQIGFYSDCLGNANWSEPNKVINEELAKSLVEIARIFSRSQEHSAQEIELWIQHIGPVLKGPMEWMKVAVANWHEAMVTAGLTTGDMKSFLGFGSKPSGYQPDNEIGL